MTMQWFEIGNLVIGAGILGVLFTMNRTIGGLSAKVEVLLKNDNDKESRIRALESKHES